MRNRLRGTLLSAAAGVAVAAAPSGAAVGQDFPTVTPGVEPIPGQRYSVPQGAMPFAGPGDMMDALPPGMLPPANAAGTGGPGRVPVGPGGPGGPSLMPDSLRPYPRISPYDHKFDQFANEGGLWMRTANNSPRRYRASANFISGKFKAANRVSIGSRRSLDEVLDELYAPTQGFGFNNPTLGINTLDGPLVTLPWVKAALVPTANALVLEYAGLAIVREDFDPDPATIGFQANRTRLVPFYDAAVAVNAVTAAVIPGTAGDSVGGVTLDQIGYEPITGDVFSSEHNQALLPNYDPLIGTRTEDADHPGFRLQFGWDDADGSGFQWSGDYLSEQADQYSRGNSEEAVRYYQNQFDAVNGPLSGFGSTFNRQDLNFRPSPLGVIVVDANPDLFGNAIDRPLNYGGVSLTNELDRTLAAFTYDLLYENEFSSQQAGTEFSYIFTPMIRRGRLRVRPSAGLRFNYVKESYKFQGLDSGAIYVQDSLGNYTTPSSTNGAFGDPASSVVINPVNGQLGNNVGIFPYKSDLDNEVSTYLFGPQAGLHADIEGKFLSVRGHVKAGVAGLGEKISVEGQGFNLNQHTTGDLMPFNDDQSHARFSPFLDANIRGEANLFPYIPVLNRMRYLKDARLTGGFSVTSFWEISRPLDSVIWREANSGNPYVNSDPEDRSQLYFTNWDVGVTWKW
ncbi:hypothetical protein [Alienimonas chondri]|uniref:Uncharacterized protein n=1 Tax=Alienimonas chondri TaxID=2681879 RepID=A0ABX1VEY9_9PLAN|nr:hypothetical protein [Alienimonas chondri]NNJ25847.1 hypothetical protein [Alienimonas chondri]